MNKSTWIIIIVAVLVIVAIILGIVLYNKKKTPTLAPLAPSQQQPSVGSSQFRVNRVDDLRPTYRVTLGHRTQA